MRQDWDDAQVVDLRPVPNVKMRRDVNIMGMMGSLAKAAIYMGISIVFGLIALFFLAIGLLVIIH
jgi:hypothetical protein